MPFHGFSPKGGPLTGATILRFAHAYESGGGTERYLDDLDHALMERNPMTVVRLHLTRNQPAYGPSEERVGQGMLIRVPLPIRPENGSPSSSSEHSFRCRLKRFVRDWGIYNPFVWRTFGARLAAVHRLPHHPGQAIGAGTAAAEVFRTRHVDLVMLHFFGGADAHEVMVEARTAGVPVALLNHYSNDRFLHLAIRKHAMQANAVAGVNGLGVPRYLQGRFTNLSDGIDTNLFQRANARLPKDLPPHPIVLLPARVVREKGQMDLVRAVASIRQSGGECCIAFAGRVDSSGFVDELRREIAEAGMSGCVRFLGVLNLETLRDWYAASAVVVLPTYHHEGLPRVVLEAQAMGVPVIAYATGGVADGITSGETGYLLPTGDLAGLAARLKELLSSPTLRACMGVRGREAAESRFSLSALAERHERFYLQIISEPKTSRRMASSSHFGPTA